MFYKHMQSVLTPGQCDAIIANGYERGFEEAPINMGDGTQVMLKHLRNNERVTYHDADLASKLLYSIEHEVPAEFKEAKFVRLGSFFRLYKYVPGQYFKLHRDGSFEDVDSASEITVLFYLNDTDGGETVLMPYGKSMPDTYVTVSPKKGDVLMFEHHILHEGKEVNTGEKFVLRTDIFYK